MSKGNAYQMVPQGNYTVVSQPDGTGQYQWKQSPGPVSQCPPGLEQLASMDRILCHQRIETMEILTGWETKNRYTIENAQGAQVYFAFEESDCCARMCCGQFREFTIHIVNNLNQKVLRIERPFKCCGGQISYCCNCRDCAHEASIYLADGTLAGTVVQSASCCALTFHVLDANQQHQLDIEGPSCIECCVVDFKILGLNGTEVGVIRKEWSGCCMECCTDANHFTADFPMDLDIRMKATLVGATFLIDFIRFENHHNDDSS